MSDSQLFRVRVRLVAAGLLALLVALFSLVVVQSASAQVQPPDRQERNITRIVTSLMRNSHLSHKTMDDEMSRRAFKLFLEGLDPMKCYFYQSDIDEFKTYEDKLDDELLQYKTDFSYVVFTRFLQRIHERVETVEKILQEDFDFTLDDEMLTDRDLMQYPKTPEEAYQRWRQRIKYDLLLLKAQQDDEKDADATDQQEHQIADTAAREKLRKRYTSFEHRMKQFDNDDLLETFLTSVTTSYDPHTTYMSPTTWENFKIALSLNLDGIGAQLQDQDGQCVVASIVRGGAADKHGKLKEDDTITAVGQGEEGEMEDIVGMKLNDVVSKIRGEAGTTVRLSVIPAGENESVIYKIVRAKIQLEDSAAHGEVFEIGEDRKVKVGVIDLPSFYQDMEGRRLQLPNYRSATRDVRNILEDFKSKDVDAVVLDLRQNGGGSLDEAVDLTGLFIDQGPVVQVMNYDNRVRRHNDIEAGMAWDGPLVVLTSKLSASASEILAGAVQDYRRGLVVGDRSTHGKGTVQSPQDLAEVLGYRLRANFGVLKITIQQFFRPNGDSTQKRGVLADITLPSITDHMDIGEADLDYALDFRRIDSSDFTRNNMVEGQMIAKLREQSTERVGQNKEFADLLKRIERFEARKERKRVSLNEEKFFADGDDSDKEEEDRLVEDIREQEETPKIKRNFYLDEVLAITRDYVEELRDAKFARVN